jgi:hypothetical protein
MPPREEQPKSLRSVRELPMPPQEELEAEAAPPMPMAPLEVAEAEAAMSVLAKWGSKGHAPSGSES